MTTDNSHEPSAINYHVSLHVIGQNVALPQLSEAVHPFARRAATEAPRLDSALSWTWTFRGLLTRPTNTRSSEMLIAGTHSSGREHDDG